MSGTRKVIYDDYVKIPDQEGRKWFCRISVETYDEESYRGLIYLPFRERPIRIYMGDPDDVLLECLIYLQRQQNESNNNEDAD